MVRIGMEICLINPPQLELREPTAYPPLGLLYLATVLEKNKIDVSVLNLAGKRKYTIPTAEVYGITCTCATEPAVKEIIETIRKEVPEGWIIVGGPHPTVAPEEVYKKLAPDVVVVGEAEEEIVKIVRNRKPKIWHCNLIRDLDSIPYPARHLLRKSEFVNLTGIHGSKKPSTTILSSRGCPFNCRFCCKGHPMFRVFRYRSAENVEGELRELKEKWGVEHVRFVDDCFTLNKNRVKKICEKTKEIGMTFLCITRADMLDRETISYLKMGGCIQADIGMETASPRLLKLMNKGEKVEDYRRAIKMLKEAGITVKVFLMMGYPQETEEDRKLTLQFLRETKPDLFTLSVFVPLSGSSFSYESGRFFYPDKDETYVRFKEEILGALEK